MFFANLFHCQKGLTHYFFLCYLVVSLVIAVVLVDKTTEFFND